MDRRIFVQQTLLVSTGFQGHNREVKGKIEIENCLGCPFNQDMCDCALALALALAIGNVLEFDGYYMPDDDIHRECPLRDDIVIHLNIRKK